MSLADVPDSAGIYTNAYIQFTHRKLKLINHFYDNIHVQCKYKHSLRFSQNEGLHIVPNEIVSVTMYTSQ